jgi:small subunit ribosomal protein S5
MNTQIKDVKDGFDQRILQVSRVSKTVKGGRRMSFSALVVVGNYNGEVGFGHGKASEVSGAVRKATNQAQKNLVTVPMQGTTIPFYVQSKCGATKLFLSPCKDGSGVIAGGAVRAVVELAGIPNIVSKIQGSRNPYTVVLAAFDGLKQLTSREDYIKNRRGN